MKKIILISGKAGNGKDTTANYIKERLEQEGQRVAILHFAFHIKSILTELYGWNGIKDEWARDKLQKLGTEVIRKQLDMPDFHVMRTCENILITRDDFDFYIIPDCRFPNEIEFPQKMYGYRNVKTVRIERENYISQLTEEAQKHESEIALDDYMNWDYYSISSDLQGCKDKAYDIAERILKGCD